MTGAAVLAGLVLVACAWLQDVPVPAPDLPDPQTWAVPSGGSARDWLDAPRMDPEDLRARLPEYAEVLAGHGLALDLEAGSVSVRGTILHDARSLAYPIEYLVVTELGRTHEALVIVQARPSVLDASLRALGLVPGAPTTFEAKEPPPPEEDVLAGRVSPWLVRPGHGPLVEILVSWVDEGGKPQQASLESLLVDTRSGQALDERAWIYTGSRMGTYRQGRELVEWFKADVEGDVVAIYLAGVGAALLERNSLDGLDDGWYMPHPERVPARNTRVTLTFRPRGDTVAPTDPVDPWGEPEAADEPGEPDEADDEG